MPKTCLANFCNRDVFSHGYCQKHSYLRTDDKYLKQKNKKRHIYPTNKTQQEDVKEEINEMDVFDDIYISSDKRSFVSGEDLTKYAGKVVNGEFIKSKMYHWLFHHVLNKKNYKKFKFYLKNIILLIPQEHMDKHSKDQEQLLKDNPNWQKVFDLEKELKEEYKHLNN
jgi:hypothetical protein